MHFSCPFCKYSVSVDDTARGYRTVCPGCRKNILVPSGRFDEGCIIGDFIITSHLGKGSIGDVYKATQISLDREVALKILTAKFMTKKGIQDFLREARAAATLSHINLVQSYAVGMDEGYIYMAMTYIKGETLKARLKREGTIPADEALHIIQQVAEALYYAWDECQIIHRDVKPDNIMLTDKGVVKLTDLGLAMYQSDWKENMEISGSPSYMSPEQFTGEPLDTRSDIYSLGVTLYQMISGRLPFTAETVTSVAQQHFEETAKPLNEWAPGTPLRVVMLVKKMMGKNACDRFANMEELLKEIWTIRQRTAPNRSLVPEIHTISIKRLDYERQNESAAQKERDVPLDHAGKQRKRGTNVWLKYLLIALPVAFLALIFAAIVFDSGESRECSRIQKKIDNFERLAKDPTLTGKQLDTEANLLLNELRPDLNEYRHRFRYADDHIRFLVMRRQYEEMIHKTADQSKAEIGELQRLLDIRTKELETLRKSTSEPVPLPK